MNFRKELLLCFLFSILFSVNAQKSTGLKTESENNKVVTSIEKKFIKYYFEAERYKLLEEYDQSILEYQNCISLIPDNSAPYYQIGKIQLYILNDLDNAEYYINEAILIDPSNEWCYYDLLTIYGIKKDFKKQKEIYEKLVSLDPENQRYYFENTKILIDLKEYKLALRWIKKIEKKFGVSNESLLLTKDIYIKQNNLKECEKIGKKLITRSPQFHAVLAEIYMHFSDYEKAIETYKNLLKAFPEHPTASLALYKIYVNKKDVRNEELFLSKIASNEHVSIETKKEIFYTLLINNDFRKYPTFKQITENAISLHPGEPLFHLILGDLYAKEADNNRAIEHYYESLYSGVIKDDYVYNKLIQIYWQQNKIDSALQTTRAAIERFPFSPEFYYYQGLAFSNKEEYQSCIDVLLKGKDYVFDNDLLKSDFYSLIGDAYHKLNDHIASDKGYMNALKYNPDNTLVLNNYSYYLSNREENLTKAKTMIIRCIELTSKTPNASYIDTYAWVLYKLGEYEQAKDQMEQALLLDGKNPVLLDHYGDILHKLGLIKKAITYWKKALALDETNLNLLEKINQNSLNE